MKIYLIKAKEAHTEQICVVLRRSITEICIPDHHNDGHALARWLSNKTPENVRRWINDSKSHVIIAYDAEQNDKVVGVCMIDNQGNILLNYLIPEYLSKGIGKNMLKTMEEVARNLNLIQLRAVSTTTAYEFYQRNGFFRIPSTDAESIEMVKHL